MTKARHNGRRKAPALGKTGAERSAQVMNPEYLAEIERFRLMDDTFMSKCLENAPECIELILQIILGKKESTSSRIQKKGGSLCVKQWKE